MWARFGVRSTLLFGMLLTLGCLGGGGAPKPKDKKEMVPVSGTVHVDGQPVAGINVMCVAEAMVNDEVVDAEYGSGHSGKTDDAGKFTISSFFANDGVPVGKYKVIFRQGSEKARQQKKGEDKFNAKFANSAKSTVEFTAEAGKPVDLGTIELKSK